MRKKRRASGWARLAVQYCCMPGESLASAAASAGGWKVTVVFRLIYGQRVRVWRSECGVWSVKCERPISPIMRLVRVERYMDELELLSEVAVLRDLPEHGLVRGQVGTVVAVLSPEAAEVEFVDDEGR